MPSLWSPVIVPQILQIGTHEEIKFILLAWNHACCCGWSCPQEYTLWKRSWKRLFVKQIPWSCTPLHNSLNQEILACFARRYGTDYVKMDYLVLYLQLFSVKRSSWWWRRKLSSCGLLKSPRCIECVVSFLQFPLRLKDFLNRHNCSRGLLLFFFPTVCAYSPILVTRTRTRSKASWQPQWMSLMCM